MFRFMLNNVVNVTDCYDSFLQSAVTKSSRLKYKYFWRGQLSFGLIFPGKLVDFRGVDFGSILWIVEF
jgi:hypothetical protein